jgi:predicted dehydrogenase
VSAPRVALVGARRARQGLGPFVARDLAAGGVEIGSVLGTSAESAASAVRELGARFGIRARPYTRLDELLTNEAVDALAILSPAETHERYLQAALDAGLHVLCEKPLVFGGADLVGRGRALVDGFRARRLLLEENCQWPHVLDAFRALHPRWDGAPHGRFAMLLAPAGRGIDALRDSLSHPLSLLQALLPDPDPQLEAVRFERIPSARETLRVAFVYCAQGARVACTVDLLAGEHVPRPAALEIAGFHAERRIRLPDYTMELANGEHAVPLPDPLTRHALVFAARLRAALRRESEPVDPAPIASRLRMFSELVDAYPPELQDCDG